MLWQICINNILGKIHNFPLPWIFTYTLSNQSSFSGQLLLQFLSSQSFCQFLNFIYINKITQSILLCFWLFPLSIMLFRLIHLVACISSSFFKKILFIFRWEGREKERERNINVWLPLTQPPPGTWPTAQACVLPDWELS